MFQGIAAEEDIEAETEASTKPAIDPKYDPFSVHADSTENVEKKVTILQQLIFFKPYEPARHVFEVRQIGTGSLSLNFASVYAKMRELM